MFVNVIKASEAQAQKLLEKHLSRGLFNVRYSYDDEDNVGFFSCTTKTNKRVECQIRGGKPCFISFSGFENTRYDIEYADKVYMPLYEFLLPIIQKIEKDFWNGSQI